MSIRFSTLTRTVDPILEPVTIDEAKKQLRVTHDEDNTYITALIVAAREWAEEFTKAAFITQTWTVEFAGWPSDRTFVIPRRNLLTVTSLKYRDSLDAEQIVSVSKYISEIRGNTVKLKTTFGEPVLNDDRDNPIEIVFTAGFGAAVVNVPQKIRLAIQIMLTHYYVNRVPVSQVFTSKIPLSAENLLGSLKKRNV